MSKKRGKWTESNMKFALNAILLNECSLREASKKFDVPKSTLGQRIKQLKSGQEINLAPYTGDYERTFTESEEKVLFDYIMNSDNQSMPLTKGEFLKLSYQYAEHLKLKHRFNKDKQMAGKDFYYNFMKRHSYLKLKTAKSSSLQQTSYFETQNNNKREDKAEYNDKAEDDNFFNKLRGLMKKYNLSEATLSEIITWLGEHSAVPTEALTRVFQPGDEGPSTITSTDSVV